MVSPPDGELAQIVEEAAADLAVLRSARILLTGGTGFVGSWLVGALLAADDHLGLDLRLVLLTRRFSAVPAGIAGRSAVEVLEGDVRTLRPAGAFDFVVHGAGTSSVAPGDPAATADEVAATIVGGTERVLAVAAGARLLNLSSGAVYGPQAGPVAEDAEVSAGRAPYGLAKHRAERLCVDATAAGTADAVSARLFTLVGPGLPLDRHFAAGNLIGDVLAGRPLVVRGDGTAMRSYLYAADLVEWLVALLARGAPGRAYNVGSPQPVSIKALAEVAAALAHPPLPVRVLGGPAAGETGAVYLPDVGRAVAELGLTVRTPLVEALERTLRWHRAELAAGVR